MNTKVSSVGINDQKGEAKKMNAGNFIQETRQEIAKVTWPNRSETFRLTIMIVVMALISGAFFLMIDSVLGFAISHILGMNS